MQYQKEAEIMVRFILGLFGGGIIGVFVMSLCFAAGKADANRY